MFFRHSSTNLGDDSKHLICILRRRITSLRRSCLRNRSGLSLAEDKRYGFMAEVPYKTDPKPKITPSLFTRKMMARHTSSGYAQRRLRHSGTSHSSPTLTPCCRYFGRMTWEFWPLYEACLIGASRSIQLDVLTRNRS